jgi:hypothetical protein
MFLLLLCYLGNLNSLMNRWFDLNLMCLLLQLFRLSHLSHLYLKLHFELIDQPLLLYLMYLNYR